MWEAIMRRIAVLALILLLALCGCKKQCYKVTVPNDVSYKVVDTPACSNVSNVTCTVNTSGDLNSCCPGGALPADWNLTNNTYLLIDGYMAGTTPYLAGVGNDPADPNNIIVTMGHPCSDGPMPTDLVHVVMGIEIAKTTRGFTVVQVNEKEK
jgi:hypothetical protein